MGVFDGECLDNSVVVAVFTLIGTVLSLFVWQSQRSRNRCACDLRICRSCCNCGCNVDNEEEGTRDEDVANAESQNQIDLMSSELKHNEREREWQAEKMALLQENASLQDLARQYSNTIKTLQQQLLRTRSDSVETPRGSH